VKIELREILKTYKGQTVLKNLNLQVNKGEFHVLLGPSGSGKTTILSIIAGLAKQDKGDVLIGNRNVSSLPPEKRRIGFAFQDYALFPHLTVFENIAYGLRVKRIKENKIGERVGYYLNKINIENEKNKFPHQLSGGQKQRVALARALVTEPEILLMDEPMSNLDPLTKEKIGDELKSIQKEIGTTTIYVTHNQEEAALLGNRVSVLHHGKIEQSEAPDELFYHPKTEFVAHFVGVNNILNVSVVEIKPHEAVVRVCNEGLDRPVKIRVKKYPIIEKKRADINLCIHPEKITLKKENAPDDRNLNRIRGKIVNETRNGNGIKTTVDLGGVMLQAAVPKHLFDFKLHENVWVCFAPDALHPLCGKKCRSPDFRKCLNGNG
jgi:molybdate transport system ATP-binding protein